jgi:hypothetical protein
LLLFGGHCIEKSRKKSFCDKPLFMGIVMDKEIENIC